MHSLKIRKKLYPDERIDTVREAREYHPSSCCRDLPCRTDVLSDAYNSWLALEGVRREAELNKMYVFGDQWGELVFDYDSGRWMTERDSIRMQGNKPVTNNRLRSMVTGITGLYINNKTEPVVVALERENQSKGEIMTATLQYVYQLNRSFYLDGSNLTNLLISGIEACETQYGYRNGQADVWMDNIDYSRFFCDSDIEDVRTWDCRLVGKIEDMSIFDVMARFSGGDREKAQAIRDIYGGGAYYRVSPSISKYSLGGLGSEAYRESPQAYRDFYMSDSEHKARVITVWRKEAKERFLAHDWLTGELYTVDVEEEGYLKAENERRRAVQSEIGIAPEDMKLIDYEWTVDNYWYYYRLTPNGYVLDEGESPYDHKSHPYSFMMYKLYDKQVFPYISGFRDQQRYINTLIMMQDFMMRAAAKGVLLVPQECIDGTDMTPEEFASQWRRFHGVIMYSAKAAGGAIPQQITANTQNLGVYDMLSVQLRMLEDSSGVQGALQGRSPQSGTPASLYMQQSQNASVTLSEMLEYHTMYREQRDMKALKLVQQYYKDDRLVNVSGNSDPVYYDPRSLQDVDFKLSIAESTQTQAYRAVSNSLLLQLFQMQAITIEDLLKTGTFPFADKLMQSIKSRQQEAQGIAAAGGQVDASMLQGIPPEIMQQVQAQANPQAVAMLEQGIRG